MNLFTKFSHSISKRFLAVFTITFAIGIIFSFAIFTFPLTAHALPEFLKPNCTASNCEFIFLAPIDFPGLNISGGKLNVGGNGASQYFKGLYTFGIAIASALAVIVIIIGGVQYSSTDAIQGKSDGKGRIQAALSGIVLALIAYTILNTINPNLVSNSFNPQPISVDAGVNQGGGAVAPVPEPGAGGTGPDGTPTSPDGTWGEAQRNAYFNSLASGPRSTDGRLIISTYGYTDDETSDANTQQQRGNRDNLLYSGSVALSPDLISKYNPEPGASVYVNGNLIGYYDDQTPSSHEGTTIVNTIDVYDPQKQLGVQLKNIKSGSYSLTFGQSRGQISNPTPDN